MLETWLLALWLMLPSAATTVEMVTGIESKRECAVYGIVEPCLATIENSDDVIWPSESLRQAVRASGFKLEVLDASQFRPGAIRLNTAVLDEIVIWLRTNFDLPRIHIYPNIVLLAPAKLRVLRFKEAVTGAPDDLVLKNERGPLSAREIIAAYDDKSQTIYLPEGWTGATAVELSVLVHEMAHHLQNLGHLKYECLPAREQIAYAAQDKWLGLFGLNLAHEFEIDDWTLAVSTKCIY